MAAADELTAFVKEGLARGLPRADLAGALLGAGWKPAEVEAALASYAVAAFPIPVPRPQANLSARDAFLYLVLFSTLFIVAINLGGLLFSLIDHWLPDPALDLTGRTLAQAVRWPVSALIAATPAFVYVAMLTAREVRQDAVKRTSKVRRWLTYLTLFVAAGVIIGDVTSLVYSLLGGELTTRFVLKVLVVGAIGGTAFWHYLSEVRADDRRAPKPSPLAPSNTAP